MKFVLYMTTFVVNNNKYKNEKPNLIICSKFLFMLL